MKLRSYGERESTAKEKDWRADHKADKMAWLSSEISDDKEVEQLLNSIDLSFLDNYLRKESQRSGSQSENDPPLSRDMFLLLKKREGAGHTHSTSTRLITLCPEDIKSQAKEMGIDLKAWFLFAVCHESVHDYSFTRVEGAKEFYEADSIAHLADIMRFWKKEEDRHMTIQSGYRKTEAVHHGYSNRRHVTGGATKESKIFYERFDEGVTDKIAFEMAEAYLQEHPDFLPRKKLDEMLAAFKDSQLTMGNHGLAMGQLNKLIAYLSQSTGLDSQIVWQAIKRGKFGVENIHDEETRRLMEAELPPEIFHTSFPKS